MQPPIPLSADGQRLYDLLRAGMASKQQTEGDKVHVAGIAGKFYAVYERLRNAAEYNEQHLLLRAAIERFLRRAALSHQPSDKVGYELVVELTEAGYLPNDSVTVAAVAQLNTYIEQYANLAKLLEGTHGVPHEKARRWTLQVLSASLEKILVPNPATDALMDFAYRHYLGAIDRQAFAPASDEDFTGALHVAVQHSLFKSDIATIRFQAIARISQQEYSIADFVMVCTKVDELYQSALANRLVRLINRNCAPLRVLRELIGEEIDPAAMVANRSSLLAKARVMAEQQYKQVHARLAKGVTRAIIFVFISKVIVGLAIEVPYDLTTFKAIEPLPLIVNLLFPAAYMATARWGLKLPTAQNTERLASYLDRMLYQTDAKLEYRPQRRVDARNLRMAFDAVYALTFIISFGAAVWILHSLQFTVVHMVIFFIFFSAVSFLRFRLLQSARELELLDHQQGFVSALADFFYTPFVRLGMWLSDKYKKANIITMVMDFAIELPIKSSLRLLRQWVGFMRDKREEM
jgi:hypothetical protein